MAEPAQPPPHPVVLHPAPNNAGSCPRCGESLEVRRLRFPGWRVLVDGVCPQDRHRYLQDLPTGHAIVYPTTIDLTTGDLFGGTGTEWFARRLWRSWHAADTGPVELTVERRGTVRNALLVDALDPIYGHALLKVLGAAAVDSQRLVLLLPQALAPLAPPAAELWTVDAGFSRLAGWLEDLEDKIACELERCDSVELYPVPPHVVAGGVDLGWVSAAGPGDSPSQQRSIVLALRDDRLWGSDAETQVANLTELVRLLRDAEPGAVFTAIGIGTASALPDGVVDTRSEAPDDELERRWLGLMKGASLAIGVHGSNFLLPSGLAAASLELLPEGRYANAFQATLIAERDPLRALHRHRTLYGGFDLDDVAPARVAAVAMSLLRSGGRPAPAERLDAVAVDRLEPEPEEVPFEPPLRARAASAAANAVRALGRRARPEAGREPRSGLPLLVTDRRGFRFELEESDEYDQYEQHGGHFESAEIAVAQRYLDAGMTAIDVGANIGAFTAALAGAVGPTGRVFAFEPWEPARRRLLRTLELNNLRNVEVCANAVAERDGAAELFSYGAGYDSWTTLRPRMIDLGGHVLEAETHVGVETRSLDSWCRDRDIAFVDLLKVDVEGAEPAVLEGAARLFDERRVGMALIEMADTTLEVSGTRAHEVIEWLERRGYWTFAAREDDVEPFRVAGRLDVLVNVVAAGPAGRARLRETGLSA